MNRSEATTTSQTLLCSLGCKKISTDIQLASLNQFFAEKKLAAIIGGHLAETTDNIAMSLPRIGKVPLQTKVDEFG